VEEVLARQINKLFGNIIKDNQLVQSILNCHPKDIQTKLHFLNVTISNVAEQCSESKSLFGKSLNTSDEQQLDMGPFLHNLCEGDIVAVCKIEEENHHSRQFFYGQIKKKLTNNKFWNLYQVDVGSEGLTQVPSISIYLFCTHFDSVKLFTEAKENIVAKYLEEMTQNNAREDALWRVNNWTKDI